MGNSIEGADFNLEITRGPHTTIAQLTITNVDGDVRTFIGDSKCHPNDEYDEEIGDIYAIGRTFLAAGEDAIKAADLLVAIKDEEATFKDEEADVVDAVLEAFQAFTEELLEASPELEDEPEEVRCICGTIHHYPPVYDGEG